MFRKLAIGVAAAAAMIGAASTANAGVDFSIGIGVPGYYGAGYYGGPGYYGAYYAPPPPPAYYGGGYYGGCDRVIVGYKNRKVWRGDRYVWKKRPVFRTVCN
jgi:hypothetical protein